MLRTVDYHLKLGTDINMKEFLKTFSIILGLFIFGSLIAHAATFIVPQGGTGSANYTSTGGGVVITGTTPTSPLLSTYSPTFSDFNATSTNATSTISHNVEIVGDLTVGGNFFAPAVIISSLTQGSVPFIGAAGLLSEDNANFFFDDTNNRLGLGTATPGDTLHIVGAVELDHTATNVDDHAFEIVADAAGFGDVKAIDIDYITGALATGSEEEAILVNIDETDATGGHVYGLNVLSTEGSADKIYGLHVGVGIGPIHQDTGSFANPTTGTNNTASTDVPGMIDGSEGTSTTIFVADNDYIIIGAAAEFVELEFIIETGAGNPGVSPTFAYSTAGSGQFTTFSPTDGTNGFRNSGVVAWSAAQLTGHTTNDDTGTYDIKITRTHNSKGNVSLFYAKSAASTIYQWDKNGDIDVRNATSTNATTTNLAITSLSSALLQAGADGTVAEYAGTTCTNQFVRALSALGVATCETIEIVQDLTPQLGGTLDLNGQDIIDGTTFKYDSANSRLSVGTDEQTVSIAGATALGINFGSETVGATDLVDFFSHRHSDIPAFGTHFLTGRSGGTHASPTIVQDDWKLSLIGALGYDGADWQLAASIDSEVDGTPGLNDMPGRLVFKTTPDGSNVPLERLRIDNAGNVGIGTTTPGSALSVAGDIYTSGAYNTSGTTGGYQIDGNLILQASSTNFSTLVGQSAGAALLADGSYNTAVGYQALYTATSSDYNTAVGYKALYSNTTGISNTAVGHQALSTNTTGANNTANGVNALYKNTTGSSNTANGVNALYNNTTGSSNTATGINALFSNTTGANNTAVGLQALYLNTTGANNTANGFYSLYSNTTGSSNTANGFYSLFSNTTGSNNTALGYHALRYNASATSTTAIGYQAGYGTSGATASQNNVFLGYQSGYANTTGNNNVLLGYQSGNSLTTGGSNILIGYDVDATSATASNELNIGNTIYGKLSTGNVGIGTNTLSAKFNVSSDTDNKVAIFESTDANAYISFKDDSTTAAINGIGAAGDDLIFLTNTAEKVRITSTGNVGIGTTTPTVQLAVEDSIDGNIFQLYDTDGNCLYNPESGGVTVTCSSDARLKTDIKNADSALAWFKDITIRDYEVIASGDRRVGVIAQEVQQVHPEIVSEQGGFLSVELPNLWMIVQAIQELANRDDEILRRLDALESKVKMLEAGQVITGKACWRK